MMSGEIRCVSMPRMARPAASFKRSGGGITRSAVARLHADGMLQTTATRSSALTSGSCGCGSSGSRKTISKSICPARAAGSAPVPSRGHGGPSPLARISAPMFARRKNQLGVRAGSEVMALGSSAASHPAGRAAKPLLGASPKTRSSRSCGLPAAAAAVSPGMGRAPGPHVPAAGPRRTEDRHAPLSGRHGLEVRPANP
jgi:hypothetical protein